MDVHKEATAARAACDKRDQELTARANVSLGSATPHSPQYR
jgi:hypothetical protein